MSGNDAVRQLWLSAPPGRMSPWQQARALALREVSRELHAGRTHLEWVAARVEKVGGGIGVAGWMDLKPPKGIPLAIVDHL